MITSFKFYNMRRLFPNKIYANVIFLYVAFVNNKADLIKGTQ